MTISQKRQFGDYGEEIAENFLQENGYKIIGKNYRVKNLGEIDIIGKKNDKLVFFEVKTRNVRRETDFPIETSINKKKRKNLVRICNIYLMENNIDKNQEWQIDGIFIVFDSETGKQKIEHMENIVWEKYY